MKVEYIEVKIIPACYTVIGDVKPYRTLIIKVKPWGAQEYTVQEALYESDAIDNLSYMIKRARREIVHFFAKQELEEIDEKTRMEINGR